MVWRAWGAGFVALAVALAGCSKPQASKARPASAPENLRAGTWVGDANGAQVTLSLSTEGRFQVVFRGGTWRSVVRGTAKMEKSRVVLLASEFNGEPATQANQKMPSEFRYSPDWSKLTSSDGLALVKRI